MKVLRRGDVIMKVDGIRVANDGSIPFRAGERVALKYYMSQLFPEDEVGGAGSCSVFGICEAGFLACGWGWVARIREGTACSFSQPSLFSPRERSVLVLCSSSPRPHVFNPKAVPDCPSPAYPHPRAASS